MSAARGPLAGLRVVEFGGMGPAPFGTMLLADLGADVVRVERLPGADGEDRFPPPTRVLARGVRSVALDLKSPEGRQVAMLLVARSDVLVEGFRPGAMERLGLGPDEALATNAALVYARMTGWGQDGPRAGHAGHDINYVAASGALGVVGRAGAAPTPPVNLVGDFGGGGMFLVVGILAAVLESRTSGHGQVVDATMLDGSALLTTVLQEWRADGRWHEGHGTNFIDSGAPFYDTYPLGDGGWIAIGAIETRFWLALMDRLGIDEAFMREQHHDTAAWPRIRERLAARLLELTPSEVDALEADTSACATRVLGLGAVADEPHNRGRGLLVDVGGVPQPAPAPRFSRTPAGTPAPARPLGADTAAVLWEIGFDDNEVADLVGRGLAHQPEEVRA